MKACIILYNMIVEDEWKNERDDNEVVDLDYEQIGGVDILLCKCYVNKVMNLYHTLRGMDALDTEKFIFNSSWTSLNIYGNCKASRRNFLFCMLRSMSHRNLCECVSFIVIWFELCM